MKLLLAVSLSALLSISACSDVEPVEEDEGLPPMMWSHKEQREAWNAAALDALRTHGQPLVSTVPADIADWCPAYPEADTEDREAFWIGFLSSLARYESTWKPRAVSSNGKWFGLLQISPATARGYDCRAGSGEALKSGTENLSCAIRIMAVTVPRDGVIDARDSRWRGVAADWGPLRKESRTSEMSAWLKQQPYCTTE
ncbi:transglycosylase SLT domain-containing protein [uncultured Roseobacter sp.]|uniref:transglycosylase SLT domain-containing protein n=1 Tax=uncultured Roseobacter sp. TaxID=114847 RepID=UPI00260579EE|nr:transglycosylase SLT domain-containing protein [uncultured Roseobacter sp.]